ncbi:MAG: acetylgalactosaminidase [Luteitalea sp.]|nr:acetylgalactosaminidase [Luteitalea sp.]
MNNRRDFLALFGLAGAGVVGMRQPANIERRQPAQRQTFNMHGYAAPKLETVRLGLIGIGSRGSGTARRMAGIEGVEIKALCDLFPDRVSAAIESIREFAQHSPESYSGGEDEWKRVCDRNDIDLIYIATPWRLHPIIAAYAMEREKHVYTELPVANTIEECWQVVETSERMRRHCFMGCGSCHDGMSAIVLSMVRDGFFGEIVHGEGNYVHDRVSDTEARWLRDKADHGAFGFRSWRLDENAKRNGTLYPQHGLGPVAQMMDLNYGDQMNYMVSISSDDFTLGDKMKELAVADDFYKPYIGRTFRGNMNITVIRTHNGRTIMLQHDTSSPRPGSRFQLISGDKAIYHADPPRIATSDQGWIPKEEFDALIQKYIPELVKRFDEKAKQAKSISKGRSYEVVTASDWRLIDCLRNGLPLEVDVYDAALWSAIIPLSEWSVAHEGTSVKVPDFTAGAWKTNKRSMDISLQHGGTTALT